MSLGVGSFLLYAQGPRSDLEVAYLNAVINGSTVTVSSATVNPGEVSPGFNLFRTAAGIYTIVFPTCKYCKILAQFSPVTGAAHQLAKVLAGFDPTLKVTPAVLANGIGANATLELAPTAVAAANDPSAANHELELIFLLGF